MDRRNFIASILALPSLELLSFESLEIKKPKLVKRYVVASDIHFGQENTGYLELSKTFVQKVKAFHAWYPCSSCFINGDIIHDKPHFLSEVKSVLDGLPIPYFTTRGNHDRVSASLWESTWGYPLNHSFSDGKIGIVLADSSNEEGRYLSPDLEWLKEVLESYKKLKVVLLFVHIPQAPWTPNSVDSAAFMELVSQYPNVKAVFHGHEHKEDGLKTHEGKAFLFDSHVGGNWGTSYNGFRVVEVFKDASIVTYMMNPDVPLPSLTIT